MKTVLYLRRYGCALVAASGDLVPAVLIGAASLVAAAVFTEDGAVVGIGVGASLFALFGVTVPLMCRELDESLIEVERATRAAFLDVCNRTTQSQRVPYPGEQLPEEAQGQPLALGHDGDLLRALANPRSGQALQTLRAARPVRDDDVELDTRLAADEVRRAALAAACHPYLRRWSTGVAESEHRLVERLSEREPTHIEIQEACFEITNLIRQAVAAGPGQLVEAAPDRPRKERVDLAPPEVGHLQQQRRL